VPTDAAAFSPAQLLALLPGVQGLAQQAGAAIMAVYATDFEVQHKGDASPVTVADERAEVLIVNGLKQLTPHTAVVAEEAFSRSESGAALNSDSTFWLVDPLDGTREFVARNGEFTVNIALVQRGQPVLGVLYAPALKRLFIGVPGQGAWELPGEGAVARSPLTGRPVPMAGLTVVASRAYANDSTLAQWLVDKPIAQQLGMGSAVKFGVLAAGQADVYPRFGRTMEWDTAAGHAVLRAAGGEVLDLMGQPLTYGKPGFENPHFVAVATGKVWSAVAQADS